ncbi:hypothetical protein Mapa_000195 [Marchantia paleacea]|nr:hypothetical protein Mapa_000195 [Marchantia paleacea]
MKSSPYKHDDRYLTFNFAARTRGDQSTAQMADTTFTQDTGQKSEALGPTTHHQMLQSSTLNSPLPTLSSASLDNDPHVHRQPTCPSGETSRRLRHWQSSRSAHALYISPPVDHGRWHRVLD